MNADEIFEKVFNKQKNFMTPHIVARGLRKNFAWEISSGEGIEHNTIYGVTIIKLPDEHRHDKSMLFDSHKEAKQYIHGLGML